MELATTLREQFSSRFRADEPMRLHTNFRIGGPARYYVEARTTAEVEAAVRAATAAGVPWFVLGGGSNTLVADAGFDGLVIQMAMRDVRVDGNRVIAGAGTITAAVARQAAEAGLTGLEWAASVPGTIGGAVRGNAGCFGGEMKDVTERVRVLRIEHGAWRMKNVDREHCAFRYRFSMFKEHPDTIILEATFALRPDDAVACRKRLEEFLTRRKVKQPLERPSAGCLFTNVEERVLTPEQLAALDRATDGAWRTVAHDGQIPTGWLIERAGCKGHRAGNVMVSEKHGNFVINLGEGTATDVAQLSAEVRIRVRDAFGIELHEEVQRLGFLTVA
jgi:UDP-N-acetylmuramate dehydrogenase